MELNMEKFEKYEIERIIQAMVVFVIIDTKQFIDNKKQHSYIKSYLELIYDILKQSNKEYPKEDVILTLQRDISCLLNKQKV